MKLSRRLPSTQLLHKLLTAFVLVAFALCTQSLQSQTTTIPGSAALPLEKQSTPSPRDTVKPRSMAEHVADLSGGVLLVGNPIRGQGTGFVISRQNRLIATAAHVADVFADGKVPFLAVQGSASYQYVVSHIWYHPRIVRKLDDGLYARSDRPGDGEVAYRVPDIAVLQLSHEGPDLPVELSLATDDDLRTLDGSPVALLGYPGDKTPEWPSRIHPANPTVGYCSIKKTTDSLEDAASSFPQRQWLWYDTDLGAGSSGSPLIASNGRVVGVHTMGDVSSDRLEGDSGFRSDCIRELIAYHHLPISSSIPPISSWSPKELGPDPELDQMRRSVRLVKSASLLRQAGDYYEASQNCNQALLLVPSYPGSLLQRAKVYMYYCGTYWTSLSLEQRGRYATWAYDDCTNCVESFPEWNEPYLFCIQSDIYRSAVHNNAAGFRSTILIINQILDEAWRNEALTDKERSFALNCRAQCHHFLGDSAAAVRDYGDSIQLDDANARWYINRAQFWDQQRKPELARADRDKAQALRAMNAGDSNQ